MRIVCISDTHMYHNSINIPEGDILICAGDHLGKSGAFEDIEDFNEFLGTQKHKYKIVIAGNHDFAYQDYNDEAIALLTNGIYLEDSLIEIEGLRIYGSPWQPYFYGWAFNLHRGIELKEKWEMIPNNIDILITHTPPYGILDQVQGESFGCEDLLEELDRISPKIHIFGHIHQGYGVLKKDKTTYINASICNGYRQPKNKPIIINI